MGRSYSIEAFSKAGSNLSGTYAYGPVINAAISQYKTITLFPRITPDAAGTGLTGLTLTVEARGDDADAWRAVQYADLNTATQDAEQAYGSGAMPGGTVAVNIGPLSTLPDGVAQMRVGVKVTGTPKASDSVIVTAIAVQEVLR